MPTFRTRFAPDIIAEFLPPKRLARSGPSRVMIVLDGLPTVPSKRLLIEYFAAKNFWVFHPRYRGTWESGGSFLEYSPEDDVRLVMDGIEQGFVELFHKKQIMIPNPEFYVCASSFGGAGSLLVSRDHRIKKAIAFSPVVDWKMSSKIEPLEKLIVFIQTAFGAAYRPHSSAWKKLRSGIFYSPSQHIDEMDGSKLCIVHAKDDEIVPYSGVAAFAKRTGAMFISRARGGHFSASTLMEPVFEKRIIRWLRS